jgi:hypothetical protein
MKNRNQLYFELSQGLDISTIELNSLNRENLIELAYALDWNGSWDIDEDGQEPITKEELINAINNIVFENLIADYQEWLTDNKFSQLSADELLFDETIDKTKEQKIYLETFIEKFNQLQEKISL